MQSFTYNYIFQNLIYFFLCTNQTVSRNNFLNFVLNYSNYRQKSKMKNKMKINLIEIPSILTQYTI